VYYPFYLALWTLDNTELEKINNYLKQFVLTENKPVEIYNKSLLDGLIRNIDIWKNKALEKKASASVNIKDSANEIMNNIEKYFSGLNSEDTEAKNRKECCLRKAEGIIEQLGGIEIPMGMLSFIKQYFSDEMFFEIFEIEEAENIIKNLNSISVKK